MVVMIFVLDVIRKFYKIVKEIGLREVIDNE